MSDLIARLKKPLPVCPFDRRSPHYFTEHQNGEPCFVCGTTQTSVDMCRMADTSIMDEAAAEIERLLARLGTVERGVRLALDVQHERDFLAQEARRYASHYPEASDGRNTFIIFAEMIERRIALNGGSDA